MRGHHPDFLARLHHRAQAGFKPLMWADAWDALSATKSNLTGEGLAW
jgi:hypothetical protein